MIGKIDVSVDDNKLVGEFFRVLLLFLVYSEIWVLFNATSRGDEDYNKNQKGAKSRRHRCLGTIFAKIESCDQSRKYTADHP